MQISHKTANKFKCGGKFGFSETIIIYSECTISYLINYFEILTYCIQSVKRMPIENK